MYIIIISTWWLNRLLNACTYPTVITHCAGCWRGSFSRCGSVGLSLFRLSLIVNFTLPCNENVNVIKLREFNAKEVVALTSRWWLLQLQHNSLIMTTLTSHETCRISLEELLTLYNRDKITYITPLSLVPRPYIREESAWYTLLVHEPGLHGNTL